MGEAMTIDGSHGEGGGQVIRTSVSLSALTGRPVRIENIRANRPKQGLSYQHRTAVKAVAGLCDAAVNGLEVGSRSMEFIPSALKGGEYEMDIGTAGSIGLVFQSCLPLCLFSGEMTSLTIRGGTDVKWSPPVDFIRNVFLSQLTRMGASVSVEVVRRGYYPKGGGEVTFTIAPAPGLSPLDIEERGPLEGVEGIVNICGLPDHIGQRLKKSALKELIGLDGVRIGTDAGESHGPGVGLVLWAGYGKTVLGADAIGERGVPAEKLGKDAAGELLADIGSGASVDVHSADQLLLYMALARGHSSCSVRELSGHTRTHIWLIERFLDVKFKTQETGGLYTVSVEGCGFQGP